MNSKYIAIGLIAVAVIAGSVVFGLNTKKNPVSQNTPNPTKVMMQPTKTIVMPSSAASTYENGTYTADGAYVSPGGDESVTVTLTIEDGAVADAEFVGHGERPLTVRYQGIFAENYKSLVVGKKLDEVKLDKVSGSSLTPKGFNDAVAKIKEQAKSS